MFTTGHIIALLGIAAGLVGVWVQAKTDIAKVQAQIADLFSLMVKMDRRTELLENRCESKVNREELHHIFADMSEMKEDIKETRSDIKEILKKI